MRNCLGQGGDKLLEGGDRSWKGGDAGFEGVSVFLIENHDLTENAVEAWRLAICCNRVPLDWRSLKTMISTEAFGDWQPQSTLFRPFVTPNSSMDFSLYALAASSATSKNPRSYFLSPL